RLVVSTSPPDAVDVLSTALSPSHPQVEGRSFAADRVAATLSPMDDFNDTLRELIQLQRGVLSRRQALGAGLSEDLIKARLRGGRWGQIQLGGYATFTGECSRRGRRGAAAARLAGRVARLRTSVPYRSGLRGSVPGYARRYSGVRQQLWALLSHCAVEY